METGEGSKSRKRSRWDAPPDPPVVRQSPRIHRLCRRNPLHSEEDSGEVTVVSSGTLRALFFDSTPKNWFKAVHIPRPSSYPQLEEGETFYVEVEEHRPIMDGLQGTVNQLQATVNQLLPLLPRMDMLQRTVDDLQATVGELTQFQALFAPSFARVSGRVLLTAIRNAILAVYGEVFRDRKRPWKRFTQFDMIQQIKKRGWLASQGWRRGKLSDGREFLITQELLGNFPEMVTIIDDISATVAHSTPARNLDFLVKEDFLNSRELLICSKAFNSLFQCTPGSAVRQLSPWELNHPFLG